MCPSDLIAEGRRLLAEATPGPWEIDDERSRYEGGRYLNGDLIADDDDCIHGIHGPGGAAIVKTDCGVYPPERPDAALICWARNNLPRLLDGLQGLTAERDTYRDELKARDGHQAAEWMGARLHRQLIGEVTTERDALKAEVERLREERDVLASEHAECPDRQKAALVLLSERAQLQEAFERATKETARLRARVERLEAAGRRWAKCYGPFYRMGGSGTEDGEAFEALMAALAPSPGEPSQLDGRAVQGVQKEKKP
jgi:hypothetical protein